MSSSHRKRYQRTDLSAKVCFNKRCRNLTTYKFCRKCFRNIKQCESENCTNKTFKTLCNKCWFIKTHEKYKCSNNDCETFFNKGLKCPIKCGNCQQINSEIICISCQPFE